MANDRYEDRYCAYIDILGFTKLIDELNGDNGKFIDIQQVLQKIHTPELHIPELSAESKEKTDFQSQSISDAVAISTKCTDMGLVVLFGAVENLVRSLLREGYFTRGAICKGKLYHDDKTVFGSALITAHALESQIVKYPRVMITKEVGDDVAALNRLSMLTRIRPSEDGPLFLHVLRSLEAYLKRLNGMPPDEAEREVQKVGIYQQIRDKIIKRFEESIDTPRHYEKVKWFADYWNRTADPICGRFFMHIEGNGLPSYFPPLVDNSIR